jgi:hypothetical protein
MEKWCKQYRGGGYVKRVNHDVVVSRNDYTAQYRRLKEKYALLRNAISPRLNALLPIHIDFTI